MENKSPVLFNVKYDKDDKIYGVIAILPHLFPIRLLCINYETGRLIDFYSDQCICVNYKNNKKVKV